MHAVGCKTKIQQTDQQTESKIASEAREAFEQKITNYHQDPRSKL